HTEEPDREEQFLRHHGRRLLPGGGGIEVRLLVESSASRVRTRRQYLRVERLQGQRNRSDTVWWPGALCGGHHVPHARCGSRKLLREEQVRDLRRPILAAYRGPELQAAPMSRAVEALVSPHRRRPAASAPRAPRGPGGGGRGGPPPITRGAGAGRACSRGGGGTSPRLRSPGPGEQSVDRCSPVQRPPGR